MKNKTIKEHQKVVDSALYYIYRYIDTDINIDTLCQDLNISRYHFQRVFKAIMGVNIYEYIKSIRLQRSASLLLTNKGATISEIAQMCGYSSQSSFIRAFKAKFNTTPKLWRSGEYKSYAKANLKDLKTFEHIEPKILKTTPIEAHYIRHKGYTKELKLIWQKLQSWVYHQDIKEYRYIALYHDNPIVTPLSECGYIATVEIVDGIATKDDLSTFIIPSSVCATFEIEGAYGDILKLIEWVYNNWLPNSGFEATTLPSYTIFKQNHFLDNSHFVATYYLPIR